MTIEQFPDERLDLFPVGMRVLAVDDDPTCLILLQTLLRKCQYHVTTTNQAITALKLLRENRNKFDLVISDVHMPDMDGFKLLELVGLELDLPVIMLSANGDTKLVMKGITHGACDYLLKPIRIEELKNIWQHVVRKKKVESKEENNSNKPYHESDGGQMGDSYQNGKLNRKRKDQKEDDDEDHADNGDNNEDASMQKKPRVVWTADLHRKFVAAVNQLGLEKAVPKRILDMMNVETLTRENVASHLQKYRLYLRRISSSQQADMVAALGGADSVYLRMGSLNGYGNYNGLAGSAQFHGQFQNAAVKSLSSSGMLGRLNSAAGLGMRGISSSSGMVQLGHADNLSKTPISNQTNSHPVLLPGNQYGSILHGMPASFEFDQVQHKAVGYIGDISNANNVTTVFPISCSISDRGTNGTSSTKSSLLGGPYNPMSLQGRPQRIERNQVCGNQSCVTLASNTEFCACLRDFASCNDGLPPNLPFEIQSNSFTSSDSMNQDIPTHFGNNKSSVAMVKGCKSPNTSSITTVGTGFPVLRTDLQSQAAPRFGSNSKENMSHNPNQGWDVKKSDPSHNQNLMCASMNSSIPPHGVLGPSSQMLDSRNAVCNGKNDYIMTGRTNPFNPLSMQHNEVEQSAIGTTIKLKQGHIVDQTRPHDCQSYDDVGCLEDLVSALMKEEEDKPTIEWEGDWIWI